MKSIFLTFITLCSFCVSAQVTTNFNNELTISSKGRFGKGYKERIDFEIPARNIASLLEAEKRADAGSNEARPFRLAEPIAIDLDIAKLINWVTDKETAYGKFTIKVNGALSTSINFDQFYLPPGTEIFVYNKNGNMITGPVTEKENNAYKKWGSWVYKGEYLTIEIQTPVLSKKLLSLHANNIAYGYKEVYKTETGGFGQSASCNINVLCPLGTGWEAERNGVALVLNDNGAEWCSGSMIMNTCSSNRPFFLTANHCFATNPVQNVTAWRFTFQAWSATCTPSQNSGGVTYNGSTLRANWDGTDFCLVELNSTPPANSGIHYAGWNRNTTGITESTIIHHPNGDVMKISRDNGAPATATFSGAQCWWLTLDQGATEGGSSGSPYFDQNHRIIGQHFGVNDANLPICSRQNKFGGRFDLSWTGNGTNATRLSNWLDPSNSGATTTNTANVSTLVSTTTSLSISGDNFICSGNKIYTANNIPSGSTVIWGTSNGYASVSGSGATGTVTMNPAAHGPVTLTATAVVNGCVVSNVATKVISVGTPYAGFNIVAHPMSPTTCYEAGAINSLQATLAFGEGYTGMQWGYIYNNIDYPGSETWDTYTFIPDNTGTYEIYVRPTNSCGAGTPTSTRIIEVVGSCGGCCMRLQVSPNPAKGILYVTVTDEDQKTARQSTDAYQITLREVISGRTVKQWKLNGNQKQLALNLTGIKKGNYMLTVQKGTNKQSKQIIVE